MTVNDYRRICLDWLDQHDPDRQLPGSAALAARLKAEAEAA